MILYSYALPPIDGFAGSLSLKELMDKQAAEFELDAERLSCEIQQLIAQAGAVARQAGWEGDLRGELRFFAVPDGNSSLAIGVLIKQDNGGTTFVVSPVELPHLAAEKVEEWYIPRA